MLDQGRWCAPEMQVHIDGLGGSELSALLAGELQKLSWVLLAPAFVLLASPP